MQCPDYVLTELEQSLGEHGALGQRPSSYNLGVVEKGSRAVLARLLFIGSLAIKTLSRNRPSNIRDLRAHGT